MNQIDDDPYTSGEGSILIEIHTVFGPPDPKTGVVRPTQQSVRETHFGVDGQPDRTTTSEDIVLKPQT